MVCEPKIGVRTGVRKAAAAARVVEFGSCEVGPTVEAEASVDGDGVVGGCVKRGGVG